MLGRFGALLESSNFRGDNNPSVFAMLPRVKEWQMLLLREAEVRYLSDSASFSTMGLKMQSTVKQAAPV